MAEIAGKEVVFEHFLDMPARARMKTIDKMQPTDSHNEETNISWKKKLKKSANLAQLALEEFRRVIRVHQKYIKNLRITVKSPGQNIDFAIESLDSLEHLYVEGDVDVQQILSKLRKPLKTLYVEHDQGILNHEQIYPVQGSISWPSLELNNQQFLKLAAKTVTISIRKLTERNIVSFIRSWQDGSIGREISTCWLCLKGSNFNTRKLLDLLRIYEHYDYRRGIVIKHFVEPGKIAKLYISNDWLAFSTRWGQYNVVIG